eukprot:Sspe_Gene.57782::Locus_31706_Transcript_1_1_Confidence_1.000_Length_1187::g.57782::m.57782
MSESWRGEGARRCGHPTRGACHALGEMASTAGLWSYARDLQHTALQLTTKYEDELGAKRRELLSAKKTIEELRDMLASKDRERRVETEAVVDEQIYKARQYLTELHAAKGEIAALQGQLREAEMQKERVKAEDKGEIAAVKSELLRCQRRAHDREADLHTALKLNESLTQCVVRMAAQRKCMIERMAQTHRLTALRKCMDRWRRWAEGRRRVARRGVQAVHGEGVLQARVARLEEDLVRAAEERRKAVEQAHILAEEVLASRERESQLSEALSSRASTPTLENLSSMPSLKSVGFTGCGGFAPPVSFTLPPGGGEPCSSPGVIARRSSMKTMKWATAPQPVLGGPQRAAHSSNT